MQTNIASHQKLISSLEPLEARIAPAAVFHFTDVDGGTVTVKSSHGNNADLASAAHVVNGQLQLLDLSSAIFQGANISMTAAHGLVKLGYLNATGRDLGVVKIAGDLGRIDAGDAETSTPGLKSLALQTMGGFATFTQAAGGNLSSHIVGALTKLSIVGDMSAYLGVSGGVNGELKSATVGGALFGTSSYTGVIDCTGDIGSMTIKGDVIGGTGNISGLISSQAGAIKSLTIGGGVLGGSASDTGEIHAGTKLGSLTIGKDLFGYTGAVSGCVYSDGYMVKVKIGGSIVGGSATNTGEVGAYGPIGSVVVVHDVNGGGGMHSGTISSSHGGIAKVTIKGSLVGSVENTAQKCNGAILTELTLGSVTIGHNLVGGVGDFSGYIHSFGEVKSLKVGGSMKGGDGQFSGSISVQTSLGPVFVGGDLVGGAGHASGQIGTSNLSAVTIKGSMLGGAGPGSGSVFCENGTGRINIDHDVQGGLGTNTGMLWAVGSGFTDIYIGGSLRGLLNSHTGLILSSGKLGSVTIGHDLQGGSISGNASLTDTGLIKADKGIGKVQIGGSILAGLDNSTGAISESASIISGESLGSLTVGGSILGTHSGMGDAKVAILAYGQEVPTATRDVAMGKISVGQNVEFANILAGYQDGQPLNSHAQIGTVKVGGMWTASNLVAGVKAGIDGQFGTADDAAIAQAPSTIISRIASVIIRGGVVGDGLSTTFGFEAQKISYCKVKGATIPLTEGLDFIHSLDVDGWVILQEI